MSRRLAALVLEAAQAIAAGKFAEKLAEGAVARGLRADAPWRFFASHKASGEVDGGSGGLSDATCSVFGV
eukprot:14070186-Alexandrium_andersonii.AAC.1